MLKRIFLLQFGRPSRIDLVGYGMSCIAGRGKVKPQNGKKPLRSKRAQKQTLVAFAIVDKLTADRTMHLLLGIRKITDDNAGPVLAETIGKNSVVEHRPSQIDNRSLRRIQGTNALDVNGLSCRFPNCDLDIAERLGRVSAQMINQVRLPA